MDFSLESNRHEPSAHTAARPFPNPPPPNPHPRPIPKPLMRYREVVLNLGARSFIITHDMLKWACLNMRRSGVGTFRRNTLLHAQKTHFRHLSLSHTHTLTQAGWGEGGISGEENPAVTLSLTPNSTESHAGGRRLAIDGALRQTLPSSLSAPHLQF